jgi:putative ABC transport system permease protein
MIVFDLARRNLRLNWLRSAFAVVGIIIGVTAISTMGILGSGIALAVPGTLTFAGNTIVISPHISDAMGNAGEGGSDLKITERQVEGIRSAAGSNIVVPIRIGVDRIVVGGRTMTVPLYAMDPAEIPVLLEKESGSYLRYGSGAMAGAKLAGENNLEVGGTLGIGSGEERVRITGILKERGVGYDISPDHALIVPDTWFTARYGELDYDEVVIKVANPEDIDGVKAAVDGMLNRREQVVDVIDTRRVLRTIVDTFTQVSISVMVIGVISLAVAGISILNVMLLSVTERTKEIGIIRALGAKRGFVLRMILAEAFILGVLGSGIGGFLSVAGGYMALLVMLQSSDTLFAPATLVSILYGVAFGIGVSLVSGIYPAWKAAMMDPVEAIRFG